MAEPSILIDNSLIVTREHTSHETPLHESTESTESVLPPADKSPFRRIEFHLARKPFTGFTNGGGDGSFQLETLNPSTTSVKVTNANQQSVVVSGRKRDASELESGLDLELSFGTTFKRIGAGLVNLGNTCFLNSVLQCLTYTEPLAAYLQSGKHQVTCRKSGFCALCAIQKHVSRALQLSGRSLAPNDLVSNLRCISRTFRNSRQEDAHEYMVNLLESMHKCCLPNGVPTESQSAYDRSLVHKIFGGRLRSQVKCMQCNYCSNTFDPFLDLSLEILRADTLYKAFANFTAKEQLDGGAKQYHCQQCKQKVKALKQLTIHKPPNVLTIHLKRFGSHISGQKIDKKIQFGPNLDLKPFVTGPYDGDLKYTLYGVLVHAGWSTHSGHYYCFVRTSSGMWYSLDDNRVIQVSEKKVFEQKAYMLFYFKDRKNFPTKKATDGHQKEKTAMSATVNGPGAPREAQAKTGPSNGSFSHQASAKKATDDHLKEKIMMNGTPNRTSASSEAQMKTGLSNGLGSVGSKEIQSNTILSNGSLNSHKALVPFSTQLNGPGASKEAQMKTGLGNGAGPVAPKEIQKNTIHSNGSLNGHKSSDPVSTQPNGSAAPKGAQMKTGLSVESMNAEISLATVGKDRNGFSPVAQKITQTDPNFRIGPLDCQKSTADAAAATPKKEASDPRSTSEPTKTEDHSKGIGGCESSDGHTEKAFGAKFHEVQLSDVPIPEKVAHGKTRKSVQKALKCKIISMKISSNVLMRTSLLNQRKKKKHRRNKRVKNLDQENSVNEGPSTSVETAAPKAVENGLKVRVDKKGAALATNDLNGDSTGSQSNPKQSNHPAHKDLFHMLTDRTLPRWDEDEPASSQIHRERMRDVTIGYIGDEWDEEYDKGRRKKVRTSKTEFDGKNPFQDIANQRLKSHNGKQNSPKRPPMIRKENNKHFNKSRSRF